MKPMIFESHAHYDSSQFAEDRDELLQSMPEKGVGTIVNVGATVKSIDEVVEMAEKYPHMYAAVGVHPDEVGGLTEEIFLHMKEQCSREKVVAIGEIGLDYYWDNESHDLQKYWFVKQLQLAREMDLPVVIHSRDATEDTLEIMKEHASDLRGVIHCFSGSVQTAQQYVQMGYFIGVGGVVTFKNGRKLKEVVEAIPLSNILLETDCPYLAPVPFRGKRNSSEYISYVAEEVARLKGISYEEVLCATEENGKRLFKIK